MRSERGHPGRTKTSGLEARAPARWPAGRIKTSGLEARAPARFTAAAGADLPALWFFILGASRRLAGRDSMLCEDLRQEAWLEILAVPGANTIAYWKTRALWRMHNVLRGQNRYRRNLREYAESWLPASESDGGG